MMIRHLAVITAATLLNSVLLPSTAQGKFVAPSGIQSQQPSSVVQQILADVSPLTESASSQPVSPSFFCGASQGIPATLAQTERGMITVIRWTSDYFSSSGWTPEARCNEVSKRFQTYSQTGALQYVTTGYVNHLPVICVAKEMNGPCAGLLLTLKPRTNPITTLRRLMNVSAYGAAPLNESTSPSLYIDMKEFLQKAPINP